MRQPARAWPVLALSAGTVAFEVLLVRAFAIEHFHHFAAMVVSVAMLGVGAGGTAFAVAQARGRTDPGQWFTDFALLTAASLALAPAAAARIELDPTVLAWDAREWAKLGALYLVLAAPFAFGALATLAALAGSGAEDGRPARPGLVYGASLVGAGLGAVLAVAALWIATPTRALGIAALIGAAGAMMAAPAARHPGRALGLAGLTALASIGWIAATPAIPRMLPSKGLPQVLAYPEARLVTEGTNPVGWVVAVEAPAFRHAPGLSLGYLGSFPPQTALFSDGDLAGALTRWDNESATLLEWEPSALPFAFGERRRVLVLGGATSHEAAAALRRGARDVTVAELQPAMIDLAGDAIAGLGHDAEVRWIEGDARSVAGRLDEGFDAVSIATAGGGGPASGTSSLAEDYDHTVEAYGRYLALLDAEGVLAITSWLEEPPRSHVRVILTAADALRRAAPARVERGLVVVRTWNTATTLVKPSGFTDAEVAAIREWADSRWFDLDWQPGAVPDQRFNLVERRWLLEAAQAATAGGDAPSRFAAGYPFDVRPATDQRPYPHHFIGFAAVGWMLSRPRGDWLAFADWGHLALLATAAQGAVLALALMLVPTWWRAGRLPGPARGRLLAYFGAIGVGYLAAEIAMIQQFTLLLGHPVYAVAAVLAAVLALSGLGSMASDRIPALAGRRASAAVAVGCVAYAGVLLPAIHLLQSAPLAARAAAAVLLLAPMALPMGLPFPAGLRALAGEDRGRLAWAWAVNGFASVITAPVAALLALEAGTRAVLLAAAAAYFTAWVAIQRES